MAINNLCSKEDIEKWINDQGWYQRIQLSNGLLTPGKIDCKERLSLLEGAEIFEKKVLDIGCNSGYYCLWAKKQAAERVVGVDIDEHRIKQALTLAQIEALEIEYYIKPIDKIAELGRFDTVFCFAVLTEIADLLGSLEALTTVIGHKAFVELALAKPIVYVSRSLFWLKSFFMKKYSRGILEIRPSKHGWMLSPSMGTIRRIIGDDFKVSYLGKGPRYDMICIERIR